MAKKGAMMEGKKIKGRKRHITVDTMGNILDVFVHEANCADTISGIVVAQTACIRYPTIKKFCADAGYRGTFVEDVRSILRREVDISEKIKPHEWEKLPWRWVVERTFGWLNNSRRLSKDYEMSVSSSENMIRISHFHTLLKRLFL